jgi:transcriptional regulator with XRE-family HTH domain
MDANRLVAWNLRRIRVRQGLSQDALGADSGVDRAYVGRLERGEKNPTVALLERLASTLSVHISELFLKPKAGEGAPKTLRSGRKARVGKFKKPS